MKFTDLYKDDTSIRHRDFSNARPSIHQDGNLTTINSYSHIEYNNNPEWAALEMAVKMKSRKAIYHHFNEDNPGDEATCREINQQAYSWVKKQIESAEYAALSRYEEYGEPIEFMEDIVMDAEPTWLDKHLEMTNTTSSLQVSSRQLTTDINFPVKEISGMIFCKLMAPSKILEWILVDGLKQKLYWVPNEV